MRWLLSIWQTFPSLLGLCLYVCVSCALAKEPARVDVPVPAPALAASGDVAVADLPPEARRMIELIRAGGPFRYDKDGSVFGNRERVLPRQPRGYYTEYTVRTPGARNRAARRIVAGGDPQVSGEFWYTDDHYQTFRRIRE
jgi:ribonuclease T1